jgi:hypothetical protein
LRICFASASTVEFPWLIYDTEDEVLALLRWGNASESDIEESIRDFKRWSVGGGTLHLTGKQWHQLRARRVGWPWNGYELQRMKDAGTYPPVPLTAGQEEEFMRRRRQ